MKIPGTRVRRRAGFTLIELTLTLLIVGVLSAVAIPGFISYQLRSKSAEAKTNLSAIRILEDTHYSEYEVYRSVSPEPATLPGSQAADFDDVNSEFAVLGFAPEGRVYFSYGVAVSPDGAGFTADAGADIDGDGFVQFWGYARADNSGVLVGGEVGCNTAELDPETLGPCTPNSGTSVF